VAILLFVATMSLAIGANDNNEERRNTGVGAPSQLINHEEEAKCCSRN